MTDAHTRESVDVSLGNLLRDLAPQVLGAVARRHEDFAAAEDAVQEALIAAAAQWLRFWSKKAPYTSAMRLSVAFFTAKCAP